jgi:hypothetical protein
VICAIDTSLPRRIDGEAAIALVETATTTNVKRFIMVTSLGTTKFGWPASALNLFWGVLYWKKQAELALIKSGMLYTIVRPGGMERPTDSYKETHNTVLYPRDSMFGGQVSRLQVRMGALRMSERTVRMRPTPAIGCVEPAASRNSRWLQVAELIATCVANSDLSANKTIEIVASDTVPPRPLEEQLMEAPQEISIEELRQKQVRAESWRVCMHVCAWRRSPRFAAPHHACHTGPHARAHRTRSPLCCCRNPAACVLRTQIHRCDARM